MKKTTDGAQENWSAERVKELTMNRITANHHPRSRAYRPIAILAACVALVFAMSVSAYAANAFGIRDLVGDFLNWNVNEEVGVLELDTDGQMAFGAWSDGSVESAYEMNLKSMTLSPTELTFTYKYKSENGRIPLPGTMSVIMGDGTKIDAEITNTSIDDDGLLTGAASFPSPIDLDETVCVLFGGPAEGSQASVALVIGVNADIPWPFYNPVTPPAEYDLQVHIGNSDESLLPPE